VAGGAYAPGKEPALRSPEHATLIPRGAGIRNEALLSEQERDQVIARFP